MRRPRSVSPRRTRTTARVLAICLVAGLTSAATSVGAHAETHVGCDTASLKEAIAAANAAGGGTITLASRCVYNFTTPFSGEDATPAITVRLNFVGNGAVLRRDPSSTARFRLLDVGVGGTATLSRVTVENGNVTGDGGGILVQSGGTLNAKSVTVRNNTAGGDGGGIDDQGTLRLTDSRIRDNTAGGFGGGLAIQPRETTTAGGTATVEGSTLYDNTANSFAGGGLFNDGGTVTVSNSSVTGNHVNAGDGAGLWNDSQMTVNDSTIADNVARDHGGGATNADGGRLTFNGSTVRNNSAGVQAGGIYNVNSGSILVLNVSRVTRNKAGGAPGGVFNGAGSTVVNKQSVIRENTPTNCSPSPVPGCVN
ncbi:hypothetical protein [Streptomyces sp. NPDC001675]